MASKRSKFLAGLKTAIQDAKTEKIPQRTAPCQGSVDEGQIEMNNNHVPSTPSSCHSFDPDLEEEYGKWCTDMHKDNGKGAASTPYLVPRQLFHEGQSEDIVVLAVVADNDEEESSLGVDVLSSSQGATGIDEPLLEFNVDSECGPTQKQTRKYTPANKSTRKRQSFPYRWKCNVAKEKLNKGEEHFNTKGQLIQGRKMQKPCDLSCRSKCFQRVTEEERKAIFDQFWKIPDKTRKWDFIARHVRSIDKKSTSQQNSRRKTSRQYCFRLKGEEVQVCKTMFTATLGLCDGWIETSLRKLGEGGSISPDKRGKNTKRPKPINPEILRSVKDHIECIPKMPSHYSRASSSREYLTESIQSVSEMFALYQEWMKENHPGLSVASYRQYLDIFNNQYNIAFFVSKKDQCDVCTSYGNYSEEIQQNQKQMYDEHIKNKDLAQSLKQADTIVAKLKDSKSLCVACFDYEKTLLCPKAKASVFYYRRKLSVSNFTVVDVGRNEDLCYVYDETVAKKGANEVGSFLWDYIKRKVECGVTDFRFYSDNCGGQNKNRFVASVFAMAAAKFKIRIVHRFLEKGHTYNAADTVHSLIERKTKPYDIYCPQQWYEKIRNAKRSEKNPIVVIEVNQSMIYDWKDVAEKLNFDKDVDGQSIPWTKIREISTDSSSLYEMKFKLNFDDKPKVFSVKKVGRPVNFQSYELKIVYNGPIPIPTLKHKDLMHYCTNNFIPLEFHDFYKGLLVMDVRNEQEDADEINIEQQGRPRKRKSTCKKPNNKQKKSKSLPSHPHESDGSDEVDDPDDK